MWVRLVDCHQENRLQGLGYSIFNRLNHLLQWSMHDAIRSEWKTFFPIFWGFLTFNSSWTSWKRNFTKKNLHLKYHGLWLWITKKEWACLCISNQGVTNDKANFCHSHLSCAPLFLEGLMVLNEFISIFSDWWTRVISIWCHTWSLASHLESTSIRWKIPWYFRQE